VHVFDSLHDLVKVMLCLLFRYEHPLARNQLVQIAIHQFEIKRQNTMLLIALIKIDNKITSIKSITCLCGLRRRNAWISRRFCISSNVLHQSCVPLKALPKPLHCIYISCCFVLHLQHFTKRSFTQLICHAEIYDQQGMPSNLDDSDDILIIFLKRFYMALRQCH
jgi:hypothetical protein